MKKTISFRVAIICLSLLTCIVCSLVLKSNKKIETTDNILNQDSTIVNFDFFYEDTISNRGLLNSYNFNVNTFQQLEKESDLIVEVRMLHHAQPNSIFISEVLIEKIYKGTYNKESLYVFEPVSIKNSFGIGFNDNYAQKSFYQLNIPTSWYIPMKKDEYYILFLQQTSGYQGENIYNYVTVPFSKVPIKEEINNYVVDISDYALIMNYNIFKTADIIYPKNCVLSTDFYNQELGIIEKQINDYTYVKDSYLMIIDETYKKYLEREVNYNETIINDQFNLYKELYK